MDGIQSSGGLDDVRGVYERAVTAVGLHLTEVDNHEAFDSIKCQLFVSFCGFVRALCRKFKMLIVYL